MSSFKRNENHPWSVTLEKYKSSEWSRAFYGPGNQNERLKATKQGYFKKQFLVINAFVSRC
jgi:hypothetical protein